LKRKYEKNSNVLFISKKKSIGGAQPILDATDDKTKKKV
jgi:hypothetical protein